MHSTSCFKTFCLFQCIFRTAPPLPAPPQPCLSLPCLPHPAPHPAPPCIALPVQSSAVAAVSALQVQFSPDGRWIVSASFDKAVKLWDGVKGTFITTFRGHVRPVYQVSWSSDSRLVVSGSSDSTLKVSSECLICLKSAFLQKIYRYTRNTQNI